MKVPGPGDYRPLFQALVHIQQQIRVDFPFLPQPIAFRAGPEGTVEGKHAGTELRQAEPTFRTGKFPAEENFFLIAIFLEQSGFNYTLSQFESQLQGFRQAAPDALFQHQAINHRSDIMLLVFSQNNLLIGRVLEAIYQHPYETVPEEVLQDFLMLPLLPFDNGREQFEPASGRQSEQTIHYLVHRLFFDGLPAMGTMWFPHPGKEQAQVIIDFGHRPHRGTGIIGGGFLVNGNGRRKPFDMVNIRLVHLPQKLPGIGGE